MNSHQSGDELHQHDLHLEALLRALQLPQELLGEICNTVRRWLKRKGNKKGEGPEGSGFTLRVMDEVDGREVEDLGFLLLLVFLWKREQTSRVM